MNEVNPGNENLGPLTRKVIEYDRVMRQLLPTIKDASGWAPLESHVAVDEFTRTGCFLEVQDWDEYTQMLTQWAARTARFETTLKRVSEINDLVYYEVEELHFRDGHVEVANSHTVFEFDKHGRIRRLAVYLQRKM